MRWAMILFLCAGHGGGIINGCISGDKPKVDHHEEREGTKLGHHESEGIFKNSALK